MLGELIADSSMLPPGRMIEGSNSLGIDSSMLKVLGHILPSNKS